MKKTFSIFIFVLVLGVFIPASSAQAVITVSQLKSGFNIKTNSINQVTDTNTTQFELIPINILNPQKINYWKVRIYCGKGVGVKVNKSDKNNCGQAVTLLRTDTEAFSLLFENNTKTKAKFSAKLKAYDINGKWLHTATKNFIWK
jgi:hypothetical protein